ncbi:MAG: tetratricopeptide repeat protein [Gammaproteobacteria bacterium]|nr:tetratricopeptide repeat protein [Gammaproteobacteria bacterium]
MEPERLQRKLAAILHADVVGYSRLMGEDESGTLARLKAHREELIDPTIASHHGRMVKLMGDGALIEFASVVDALACAVEVQRGMSERNQSEPQEQRIEFRIGINLGDIIIDGDDIYGDGVNVAARLEGLADPAGICISESVRTAVGNKLPLDYEFMGEQQVKNIADAVRSYRVVLDSQKRTPETSAAKPKLEPPDKPSIAVLPFTNMSHDPEQEYFADGIVEDIITELSLEPDLFVIARNSSFAYKGKSVDIRQIARELGVRYVLEGSVRKAGNRIRLNAQLIDAETNHHIWAERYDRAMEDVFEIQDELTNTIQNTLLQKVRDTSIERALRRAPRDLDAYDHMLRGFGSFLRFDKTHNIEAIREAEAALAIDPDYARAHTMLAWAHLYSVMSAWTDDAEKALELGYQAALKGVAADGQDYWGYTALGFAELCMHHNDRALAAVDRAVALNPNNAEAHAVRGTVLNFLGRPEEGLAELELAMRHNPHYPDWYLTPVGRAYYLLGRYDEGIPYLERLVNVSPEFVPSRAILAASYMAVGRSEDARAQVTELLQVNPTLTSAQLRTMVPFSKEEDLDRYLNLLRQAGLPE